MEFRAALAMLIAIVMLSVSCVASACEASCDLKVFGLGCHHDAPAGSGVNHLPRHSGVGMSGMRGCGMKSVDSSAHSPFSALVDPSSCKHSVCEQQPQALASDKKASAAAMQQAGTIVILAFPLPEQVSRWQPSPPPPFRSPLLVSLQTPIRI